MMLLASCQTGVQRPRQTAVRHATFTPLTVQTVTPIPTPTQQPTLNLPSTALEQTMVAPDTGIDLVKRPLHFILVQAGRCAWDESWCVVERGILAASREMNVTVTLLGPDSASTSPQENTQQTTALIDQAVADRPDGIALTIHDPAGLRAPILAAIDSGIPVIAYHDGAGPIQDELPYLTYLGLDNMQSGYQGGQRMIQAGVTSGVCLNEARAQIERVRRCKGFVSAFSEAGLNAETLDIPVEIAQGQAEIEKYAQSHAQTNAYLTTGPGSTQAFYAWLDSSEGGEQIIHGAFEPDEAVREHIQQGTTLFGIDAQPYLEGYETVFWLTMISRYGFKPAMPVIPTGPYFIDQTNLETHTDPERAIHFIFVQHARCSWDSYWCVVERGIQQAALERNVQVSIQGPDQFDLNQMAALIDQAVRVQPDGMGVTIPDPAALHAPILHAIQAGFPVVAYDTANGPLKDDLPYLTFIGTDSDAEYQGGYLAGRRLILVGAKAGVCANHQKGHVALDARCRGMADAFKMAGLKVDTLDIGGDPEKALINLRDYAEAHPEVNAYLTLGGGDPGAVTFYRYLAESNRPSGMLLHGTYDLSAAVVAAVQDGTTLFAVDGQPYLMGYSTVMFLTLALRQNVWPVEAITATGPGFVDLSNIDIVAQLAGIYR